MSCTFAVCILAVGLQEWHCVLVVVNTLATLIPLQQTTHTVLLSCCYLFTAGFQQGYPSGARAWGGVGQPECPVAAGGGLEGGTACCRAGCEAEEGQLADLGQLCTGSSTGTRTYFLCQGHGGGEDAVAAGCWLRALVACTRLAFLYDSAMWCFEVGSVVGEGIPTSAA